MPEVRYEVKTFSVEYHCDVQGCDGVMRWNGMELTSYPAQYPHICNVCKAEKTFRGEYYPKTVYQKAEKVR
jgi:hypothetical protein